MSTSEFSFANEILKEIAKWGVPLLGALVAVFFTPLVEHIRTRINRADLRTKQYEEFAADLSHFLFHAELVHQYFLRGWTKPKDLDPIIKDYNDGITAIRKKEYVYLSWAHRYWKPFEAAQFVHVVELVKEVDGTVHMLFIEKPSPSLTDSLATKTNELSLAMKALLLPSRGRA